MYDNSTGGLESLLAYSQCIIFNRQSNCAAMPSSDSSLISMPSTRVVIAATIAYISLVQLLRFRRKRQIEAYVAEQSPLTPETAQQVIHKIATLEFPAVHKTALQFALFRTYGIPTISELLLKTSIFSSPETAARRYADTGALISEFLGRTYGTRDWIMPMARTNAIHGHYRDKGKILEPDMLYTLLLFARQPWKWIDKYEWRTLTEAELDGLGTFWRAVGEAMEIDYTGLEVPGWTEDASAPMTANGRGRAEWTTGADWLRAVDKWADTYERQCMVPSASNAAVAEQTVALLLDSLPKFLHPLGKHIVSTFMDDRLRMAMSIPKPPVSIHCTVHSILTLRKYVLRYAMPPRPTALKMRQITEPEDKTAEGRHHYLFYDNMPYYVEPTLSNRWGLRAWTRWFAGKPLPGDKGMNPEGYFPDKVGPPAGRAPKEQQKREKMVEEVLIGKGCPMAFR